MKRRRELGQEYTMRSGGVTPARSRADRRQCKSKGKERAVFSEVDRLLILQHIWTLSWSEKRNFVYGYYLKIKEQRKPVCLKMFLNTTGLSTHFVMSMFDYEKSEESANDSAQTDSSRVFSEPKKSRKNHHYKRGKESHQLPQRFLHELPKLPGHYCRKTSSKLYLERGF
ncbi:hypothetical protein ElyMa_003839100 [Elysia marginata]|uniref:Uncharacterized protein n=1 Tax=Elysia marginata TaxID=1093978 RepID=A0AAV4FHQ7_9GAST|nr:hypothetical protein ElyMa_003839100 [Elysia marginata]